MKHLAKVIGIAGLFPLLGTIAPAYARGATRTPSQARTTCTAEARSAASQAFTTRTAAGTRKAGQAPAQQTQRASNDRGGGIPDDRFRAHFGRDQGFCINRPVMVSGSPRFQYGSYCFEFVDRWPVGWSYTERVYINYINGGYAVHPGFQISINVVL
jgi:hypothetical protein